MSVQRLYSRYGKRRCHGSPGNLRISKLSVFNTDVGFDSRRLHQSMSFVKPVPDAHLDPDLGLEPKICLTFGGIGGRRSNPIHPREIRNR